MALVRNTALLLMALPVMVRAAEVIAVDWEMQLDGKLAEWGSAHSLSVDPGGDLVGLRGVFRGSEDFEADVYFLWDAHYLYIAATVADDSLDVGRIAPDEKAWQGPGGERQNRMFYYDHLKVFVRGPGAHAGTNLWISSGGEEGPYVWGNRQRRRPSDDVPAIVGVEVTESGYGYEVALPWKWLEIYPESGMVLDALFLITDSDLPGISMGRKVRKGQAKWIWWKGTLTLSGEPPDLEPPPVVAPGPEPEKPAEAAELVDSRVHEAIARLKARQERVLQEREKEAAREQEAAAVATAEDSVSIPGGSGTAAMRAASAEASAKGDVSESASRRLSGESIRDRLRRRFQVVEVHAPKWVARAEEGSDLKSAQIDSMAASLHRTLIRLAERRISSRTDMIVMDMAAAAGSRRSQASEFLQSLLRALERETGPGGVLWPQMKAGASSVGVSESTVSGLLREVAALGVAMLEKGEVTTTGELLDKSADKTGISKELAREITRFLLGVESP